VIEDVHDFFSAHPHKFSNSIYSFLSISITHNLSYHLTLYFYDFAPLREKESGGGVLRHTTFGGREQILFCGAEGSKTVPASPADEDREGDTLGNEKVKH
jgi:hypothetical protein